MNRTHLRLASFVATVIFIGFTQGTVYFATSGAIDGPSSAHQLGNRPDFRTTPAQIEEMRMEMENDRKLGIKRPRSHYDLGRDDWGDAHAVVDPIEPTLARGAFYPGGDDLEEPQDVAELPWVAGFVAGLFGLGFVAVAGLMAWLLLGREEEPVQEDGRT